MGGRGSNINAMWRQVFQPIGAQNLQGAGAPPPNVQPGQPVPAITIQQLQAMNDTEFANYMNGLKNTPIDANTYYNNDWDTQRLVANVPELNQAPQVVDAQTFSSLPGETLYRTVNATGNESAVDICARTMASDVTTIGAGVMGDGFYFANSKTVSQRGYGNHLNDINKTATMAAKLNQNARVVSNQKISDMLSRESATVRNAVNRAGGGNGQWGNSGLMAYALKKGYNAIKRSDGVINLIDRNAATWSGEIVPYT